MGKAVLGRLRVARYRLLSCFSVGSVRDWLIVMPFSLRGAGGRGGGSRRWRWYEGGGGVPRERDSPANEPAGQDATAPSSLSGAG
jgi:hypothetical protein